VGGNNEGYTDITRAAAAPADEPKPERTRVVAPVPCYESLAETFYEAPEHKRRPGESSVDWIELVKAAALEEGFATAKRETHPMPPTPLPPPARRAFPTVSRAASMSRPPARRRATALSLVVAMLAGVEDRVPQPDLF
jgi:hypothetical protein